LLRYTFEQEQAASRIEAAVRRVLADGLRTGDIYQDGCRKVGTKQMGEAVVAALAHR
jgi:3-isopropylmalate dehydrogenase